MKSTGIVRKIDGLGRLVIPKILRKIMDINKKDPMEIFVDGEIIILRKYEPACIFCDSTDNNLEFEGRKVCQECIENMNKENI